LNHFTVLIYPFVHGVTDAARAGRLAGLAPRWRPWWSRLADRDLARALDDTAFFLPYIRGLLYPETAWLDDEGPGEGNARWAARPAAWCPAALGAYGAALPDGAVVRLTCRPELAAALAEFTLLVPRPPGERDRGPAALPGRLDWIDAVLFPSGIGFLLLKAR